jgi:aminomethyltransferase
MFAGFEMPLWYKGISEEHMAVRNNVGIFDITHMGRAIISGEEAESFLNYVTTNDVTALMPMSAQYSIMCNENGGIIDDCVLCRSEKERFLITYNASNRDKDFSWLLKNSKKFKVKVEDVSDNIAMFAVQGPKAEETLQKISSRNLSEIERFHCGYTKLSGIDVFLSRTGYTGEDGFEIYVLNTPLTKPENAVKLWHAILEAGAEYGIEPCGLGARDTLRLEAGMCLYGNDIDENITPLEAGLGFVVKLQKTDFIGKGALNRQKEEGIKRKRVAIRMLEQGVPRQNYEVYREGQKIGHVTSGTFSPLLKCGIAAAYVLKEYANENEKITVKIREKFVKGEITKFPFYDPSKYGYKRVI